MIYGDRGESAYMLMAFHGGVGCRERHDVCPRLFLHNCICFSVDYGFSETVIAQGA